MSNLAPVAVDETPRKITGLAAGRQYAFQNAASSRPILYASSPADLAEDPSAVGWFRLDLGEFFRTDPATGYDDAKPIWVRVPGGGRASLTIGALD